MHVLEEKRINKRKNVANLQSQNNYKNGQITEVSHLTDYPIDFIFIIVKIL